MKKQQPNLNFIMLDLRLHNGDQKSKTVLACVSGYVNDTLINVLHPDELSTYKTFKLKKRQVEFLNGRWAAKLSCVPFLKENDLTKIKVVSPKSHRPFTQFPTYEVPDLGISHTRNLAVAVSFLRGQQLAIDIETVSPALSEAKDFIMTESEQSLLKSLGSLPGGCLETAVWSGKEALAKLCGLGFMVPLNLYEISAVRSSSHGGLTFSFLNFREYEVTVYFGQSLVLSLAHRKDTKFEFMDTPPETLIKTLESWAA